MHSGSRQAGFTLIELVMTLVIVAVLAAVALPSFQDLSQNANVAAVNGLSAAVRGAANHMRMLCAVSPQTGCSLSNPQQQVTLNGKSYWFNYGWPEAGDDIAGDEVDATLTTSGFTISLPDNLTTLFSKTGAPTPAQCSLRYQQASSPAGPTITLTTTGC